MDEKIPVGLKEKGEGSQAQRAKSTRPRDAVTDHRHSDTYTWLTWV
jgi:hypothetical protein